MKLFHSHTSPFVRKIMVLAIETGLDKEIELITTATSPIKRNKELAQSNPLGKIPALVTDEGTVLFDSRVIMQYLDSLHHGAKFYPAAGAARFRVLRDEALADGILDALVLCRYETFLRPAEKQWHDWVDAQMTKVLASLNILEGEIASRQPFNSNGTDAGLTAIAAVFGYIDFRQPDLKWRDHHPKLAAWLAKFSERPAIKATAPHD